MSASITIFEMKSVVEFDIIKNKQYNEDYEYAFKYNCWLFYISGTLPVHERNLIFRIFIRFINFVLTIMCFGFLLLPLILEPIFSNQDQSQSILDFILLNISGGFLIKYIIFYCNNKRVQICMKHIQDDWCNNFINSRDIMFKYAKFSRNITIFMNFVVTEVFA